MLSLYHCSFVTTCDRNDIIGIDRNAAILRMQVFAQLGRMNYCMHEWSNVCEQTLGGLYRLYTIRTYMRNYGMYNLYSIYSTVINV